LNELSNIQAVLYGGGTAAGSSDDLNTKAQQDMASLCTRSGYEFKRNAAYYSLQHQSKPIVDILVRGHDIRSPTLTVSKEHIHDQMYVGVVCYDKGVAVDAYLIDGGNFEKSGKWPGKLFNRWSMFTTNKEDNTCTVNMRRRNRRKTKQKLDGHSFGVTVQKLGKKTKKEAVYGQEG